MRTTTYRVAALAAAAALTLAACGDDGGTDEPTTDAAAGDDAGSEDDAAEDSADDAAGATGGSLDSLTIGIKFDQPGLGIMEGSTPTGMDVDVAKAVAEKLGVSEDQITWTESVSAQREAMLEAGQVDMIVATYSITDARKEQVQFAGPYFVAGQDLLVAADSDITGPEDLDGRLLCSVSGSTSAENVKEDVPGVQLQEYQSYSECMEQVSAGTIEALTTDDTILAGFAAQEQYAGNFKVVGNPFSEELYGIGLPKESEYCEDINTAISELWEDGTMEQIIEDNLGAANYTPNADLNPPEPGGHCG